MGRSPKNCRHLLATPGIARRRGRMHAAHGSFDMQLLPLLLYQERLLLADMATADVATTVAMQVSLPLPCSQWGNVWALHPNGVAHVLDATAATAACAAKW